MPGEVVVSTDEKAQELARQGFYVFPSAHKKKHINGWPTEATRDPEKIKKWFGPGGTHESWKISIFTGKFGDDEALVVVDIDPRNGGDETIRAIEAQHPEAFPPTREHRTPNGGLHKLYRTKGPGLKSVAHAYGQGVDAKSAGGLVHFGDGYELIHDPPVAKVSQYLLAQSESVGSTSRPHPRAQALPSVIINQEHAEARAIWYLEHDALPAIQGQGGDQTTFAVAARIKDFGVPEQAATMLMWEHWNDRCEPRWEPGDLETKVQNAYKYSQNPFGVDAPEVVFPPLDPPAPGETKELHPYDKLNKDHAFVIAGGGSHILWETTNADGQEAVEHLDLATFKNKLANQKMMVGNKTTSVASQWLEWKGRRSYDGIIFSPGQPPEVSTNINGRPKKYFNLWRGFAYDPAPPGSTDPSLDLFLEHLNLNVCGGSEALYRWLLGFFAHLVQCPEQKPEVAIVLRGGKGVGKTMVAETIGDLLGRHFLLTSDRRYLTGNFNGHLENCLMLALDEAFWSGDKQAEGTLKNLITGREHVIEHKGKEPYVVANKTRIIICSNENWVVPVSHDERRFAFFDVGDGRKQDRVFFRQIRDGLRNGGYPVLLRYLKDYVFSAAEVNTAPVTEGLLDQKLLSDDPLMQWWYQCLVEGRIIKGGCEGWPEWMESGQFQDAMKRSAKDRNIQARSPDPRTFGKRMKPLGVANKRQRDEDRKGQFIHAYSIPPLLEARKHWDASVGQSTKWDE